MRVRKILCAVDLSRTSEAAMRAASDLARHYEASLTLLHVFPGAASMPHSALGASRAGPGPELAAGERHARGMLEDWQRIAIAAGAPNVVVDTSRGDAAAEIRRQATDGAYDLIVVGTHGQTGVLQALLGAVAYKLVRSAPCSVLTVRAPAA